jgi:alkylation response protein AidB-like acyl-CoA dehydrogenase
MTIELEPSPHQQRLRADAQQFLATAAPMGRIRELADDGATLDRHYMRATAGFGWCSLLGPTTVDDPSVPGIDDAACVAEVRGAGLQPGPFVPTQLATYSLARLGGPHQMQLRAEIASGESTVSWAWADENGQWSEVPSVCGFVVNGAWELNGCSGLVQDADHVDWLMVRVAMAGEHEMSMLVPANAPGLTVTKLDALDRTRSWHQVTFDDVRVLREPMPTWRAEGRGNQLLLIAATLTMAESVGAMDALFRAAVGYAKQRVAFGRAIGSFQAIKHLLADCSVALEASKAMAHAAMRAVGDGRADSDQIVHMAKSFVGDAGIQVANGCWQTYGGVAYRWDHDFHLFLRRLVTDASLYGDATWHREQLCRVNSL